MARKQLLIVLFLITCPGCAGQPWFENKDSSTKPLAVKPSDREANPPTYTPGFLPSDYAGPESRTPGAAAPPRRNQTAQNQTAPNQFAPNQPAPYQRAPNQSAAYPRSTNPIAPQQSLSAVPNGPHFGPPMSPLPHAQAVSYPPVNMFDPNYIGQVAAVAAVVKDQLAARDAVELTSAGPMTASSSANATSGEDIDRAAAFNINDMPAELAEAEAAGTAEKPAEQLAEASPDQAAATASPSDDMPPASETPAGETPAGETPAADGKIEQASHTQKTVEPVPGNWREQTQAVLTSVEKELTSNTISESQRTHLNGVSRLLHAILNDTEKALAPIENAGEDEREFWKHMVHGLMISLDADEKNPTSRRSALTLRSIRLAADYLANVSTLDVRNVAFCSKVESYGRFDEFKSYGFKPGQEVLLYVEVENFAVESQGDRHETELQGEYTIYDADGKRVANAVLPLDKQASNNRRRDYFIPYRIFMPKKIEQGHYTLQLTMEDVKGSKSNQASVEFWIR